ELMRQASHQGFTHVEVVPYDIVHPLTPRRLIRGVQSLAFVLEHAPMVRELCGTLYIWLVKPGMHQRPRVNLAARPELRGAVSVVVPAHNEEMNIQPLVQQLLSAYGDYIREIIVVDDNSTDRTAAVTLEAAAAEPRV